MDNLKNFKKFVSEIKSKDKVLIEEMIKETEAEIKKSPKEERACLISLHNQINTLVVDEPNNNTYRLAKNRMDEIILSLQ